jgi:multidrug efflux pump subunit AcrA (membrane-fusion protein)
MSLRKVLWFVLPAVILGALGWWIHRRSSGPPEAPFARVQRERLVSTLVTNGRAEPWEWVAVRAERPGLIERVAVEKGARVSKGAVIAEVEAREAHTDLATDSARVFPAQAELEGLKQGGRTVDLAEIESGLARGMPVTITWGALPGRQWKGTVDQVPIEVAPLATRQVGEVLCTIDNPGRELLPGTNINAEIVSQVVDHGLVIPKEALRRQSNRAGVLLLRGEQVFWRPITPGASSVTRRAVLDGLAEGDAVALAPDRALHDGERVRPVYR